MVRTQLQLDETTYEALRKTAHTERKSMSEVAREILSANLVRESKPRLTIKDFPWVASGASTGKRHDISTHHDEALGEDFE